MEKPDDPMELRIYPGANGSFTLYEDEGDNYDYEKGIYATIPMKWDDAKRILTIGLRDGEFPGMLKTRAFRVVWVRDGIGIGPASSATVNALVQYDGHSIDVRMMN